MKYLKSFNESVDKDQTEEIKQTIKDILLPISDMGYEISIDETSDFKSVDYSVTRQINKEGYNNQLIIRVIHKNFYLRHRLNNPPLKLDDEVKEEFIRLKDYLESMGFKSVEVVYVIYNKIWKQNRVDFSEFISIDNCELRNLLFIASY
jgi:hypothetical protein